MNPVMLVETQHRFAVIAECQYADCDWESEQCTDNLRAVAESLAWNRYYMHEKHMHPTQPESD